MEVTTHVFGEAVILSIDGDMDAATSPLLAQKVNALLAEGKAKLVVDLSNVLFMDSSGLATLVLVHKRTRSARGEIRVCGLQEPVQELFDMTQIDRMLAVFPDAVTASAGWAN